MFEQNKISTNNVMDINSNSANISNNLHSFVDLVKNNTQNYSQSIEEAKYEIQKVKKFLFGLEDINDNEEYSTKNDLISEITNKVNTNNIETNKDINLNTIIANNDEIKEDIIKIKGVFDYIRAIDKEIEKNKQSK